MTGEWVVIGPFGNTLAGGWDRPFPPEWEIDLYREYEGSHGTIRWHFLYADDRGTIGLLGPCWPEVSQIPTPPLKEYEVGYLFTNLLCAAPANKRIIISSPFRYKLWVNHELAISSTGVDQAERSIPIRLSSGKTPLLLKLEKLLWWEWKLTVRVVAQERAAENLHSLRALVQR